MSKLGVILLIVSICLTSFTPANGTAGGIRKSLVHFNNCFFLNITIVFFFIFRIFGSI